LITKTKIFKSLQNIQKSKLAKFIVANARFNQNILFHYFLDHVKQHFFYNKKMKKEIIEHEGTDIE
jgi:hypothetical protein